MLVLTRRAPRPSSACTAVQTERQKENAAGKISGEREAYRQSAGKGGCPYASARQESKRQERDTAHIQPSRSVEREGETFGNVVRDGRLGETPLHYDGAVAARSAGVVCCHARVAGAITNASEREVEGQGGRERILHKCYIRCARMLH